MRSDGTGVRQVTRNGAANFAPFMHPNGQQIIFSSNLHDPTGRSFALSRVKADGSGLGRGTYAGSAASVPLFRPRRRPPRVLRKPPRPGSARDERLRRRLDRVMTEPRHALPETLVELMSWRQRTTPETAYFTVFGNEISYGQFWRSSLGYAGSPARAGMSQGDKVCLVFPTCAEF